MTSAPMSVDAALVRALLRDQHPDLADRPIRPGAEGWDNQLWRLGDDLAVRLPWATDAADTLLLKEHEWVPALAADLPLPVPVPQRLGRPSAPFPRPWIVTTWVPGTPADREPATDLDTAEMLAGFLTALHRPAPASAPDGRGRGGSLHECADQVERSLAACAAHDLLPDGVLGRFHDGYGRSLDDAQLRRARGWAVWRALGGLFVGEAGRRGRPGGKASWGPPARLALERLAATVR